MLEFYHKVIITGVYTDTFGFYQSVRFT